MEKFLEEAPLYQKNIISDGTRIPVTIFHSPPAITTDCPLCKGSYTFNAKSINGEPPEFYEGFDPRKSKIEDGNIYHVQYQCKKCNYFIKHFYLLFEEITKEEADHPEDDHIVVYVQKIGQLPPYSIEPESTMTAYLDDKDLALYKNGLITESQSYGIGAFAYYRQVLENKINNLVGDIEGFVESADTEIKARFEEAKKQANTADKIKLIYDYLPGALKPAGNNVLKMIYTELSDGIHNKSDEQCLQSAQAIRGCLVFLIRKIEEQKSTTKAFQNSVEKIKLANDKQSNRSNP